MEVVLRILPAVAVSLALVATPPAARADVWLGWSGGCTPPPFEIESYSTADHVLTVSIDGISVQANGIDITLAIFNRCFGEGDFIPQAWRFDPAGCQSGALRVEHPASFGGCAGLPPGPNDPMLELVSVSNVTEYVGREGFPHTYPVVYVRVAHTFPTTVLLEGQRYVVARIHFDMSNTVAGADPTGQACGCGSTGREIQVVNASLGTITEPYGLRQSYANQAFWSEGVGCVIDAPKFPAGDAAAASDPACLTTAAAPRSWGALKAQYR